MTPKEISPEMAKKYGEQKKAPYVDNEPKANIEWLTPKKDYSTLLKFRVFPANSKENQFIGGAFTSGVHWLEVNGKKMRFQCPEKTFPESGVVCPVCAMKRSLLAQGYSEADMSRPNRFGEMENVLNPRITSAIKCLVGASDKVADWDKAHISILQQNGETLLKWLVQEYMNEEKPNFTDWTGGAMIKFSRDTENGKWNREVLSDSVMMNLWQPTPEVLAKVQQENEDITIKDLFHLPTDEQVLQVKELLAELKAEFDEKRAENQTGGTTTSVDDTIPF